jgi:hypothetical protein
MANSKRLRVYRIWPGGEVELIKTFENIFRLFSRVKGEDYLKTIPSSQEFRTILEQERARADRLGYQFSLLIFLLGNWEDRLAIADHLTRALKKPEEAKPAELKKSPDVSREKKPEQQVQPKGETTSEVKK